MVVIDKVIGVGEIAIADYRSSKPSVAELARIVSESLVGGTMSGEAGVTHLHTGAGTARFAPPVAACRGRGGVLGFGFDPSPGRDCSDSGKVACVTFRHEAERRQSLQL